MSEFVQKVHEVSRVKKPSPFLMGFMKTFDIFGLILQEDQEKPAKKHASNAGIESYFAAVGNDIRSAAQKLSKQKKIKLRAP